MRYKETMTGKPVGDAKKKMLYFAKVRPEAKIPTKKFEDAGYDLYPCFPEDIMVFLPNETKLVPTGIAAAISPQYYLQVQERGSTGSKGIKYSAGVIDSGYRGEIFIAITNVTGKYLAIMDAPDRYKNVLDGMYYFDEPIVRLCPEELLIYPKSKAIAQLIIHRVHNEVEPKEISYEELKAIPSERGTGMLGSSEK